MRDFVKLKGFGEIKQDGIYLCLVVYSYYSCLGELELTRQLAGNRWKWRMVLCLC